MRSRLLVCAALASVGLSVGVARSASAADPKAKSDAKSKKSSSGDVDDKGIGKTLQWEDKVMGPDDKRGELDKILRAQAINKAATEKAERDKEKADKERAAKEAKEAAAPKAQTTKKGGEVALPSLPDEEPAAKGKSGKSVEISPKLDTAAAAAAPAPVKPADDKFIDKLLKEEGSGRKKKAVASDDKSLLDILSADKPAKAAAPKAKGKKDGVDSLLLEADKEPAMPTPKIKHETPEWQKPEIQSTPVAAPVVARPVPKRDDGVIHVVQGAATSASRATPMAAARTTAPSPAARRPPAAAPPPARGGNWNDPFADSPRKTVASRSSRNDDDDVTPAPRRNVSAPPAAKPVRAASRTSRGGDDDSWDDPFDAKKAPAARRATAPVAKPVKSDPPGRWKDPFTDEAAAKPARGAVAMRDSGRSSGRDSGKDEAPSKWNAAAKHPADDSAAEDDGAASGSARGRWGILKKRAH